jgi:hypothetical protein
MGLWGWFGLDERLNQATELFAKYWENLQSYALLVLRAVTFFTASISLFFVGMFVSIGGLDYFLLIDKRSMLASMFVYTAILSSISVAVSFVPLLFTTQKHLVWSVRAIGFIGFLLAVIGLEYTGLLLLLGSCLVLLAWLKRDRTEPWSLIPNLLTVSLLCCLALGYMRGEYLRDQRPSMTVQLTDAKAPALVNVIMSTDQGVLVFEPPSQSPRLYPWSRIGWIGPAPQEGDGFRLRHWRDAMQGSTAAAIASLRGWLRWGGDTSAPQSR